MSELDAGIERETIPFYPTKLERDIKTLEIKYTLSGSVFKLQLPIFKEGSSEKFLHFIHEFTKAKNKLGYGNSQKSESGLEQLLQGNARQEWNTIKSTTLPGIHTIASFNEQINAYKKIYIPDPSAIDNQRSYLNRVRKNDRFTVHQFLDRLKHINMLIAQFPGATNADSFTPTEIKQIFYHSIPTRWRANFINSGQSLQTTTVEALRTYMVQHESQTDAHRWKSRDSNGNKKPSKIPFNRFKKNSSNGARKHTSNNRKQDKEQKNKKLTNDDDCPIHGNSHKWGQCHQNQYGEKFRP